MTPPRRGTPARTSGKSGAAPLPKGARIPQPSLFYWLARMIVIGPLILFFASPALLTWASAHQPPPATASQPRGGLLTNMLLEQNPEDAATSANQEGDRVGEGAAATEADDWVAPILASATITVLTPRLVAILGKIGVLGASLMLGEALLACWGMWMQRRAMPQVPTIYLLVRATMPSFSPTSGRMGGSSTPSGDQLFRAIQQAIPRGTRSERFRGRAPWVAFTLTGIPTSRLRWASS